MKSKEFIYKTEQILPVQLSKAWEFFSSPNNLALLTPKEMDFKVLTKLDNHIYDHMIIDYTVKPLFHIPLHWRTEILDVQEMIKFTDIQLVGPFKLWKHVHQFVELEDGVLVKDCVHYKLPFGVIGQFLHSLFIKKRIEDIFSYRMKVLEQLFIKQ
jgi:ligand-binding SRPBCC domain-containing protein